MICINSLVDNEYKLDIHVSHINETLHASNCGKSANLVCFNA